MIKLNKQQSNAVLSGDGVHLVIAGAGTGKTKTLIEKVNTLITDRNADPSRILILTFSKKAAEELRERITRQPGATARNIKATTFHSLCLQLLKDHNHDFMKISGYKYFPDVIEESKREALIKNLVLASIDKFYGMPAKIITELMQSAEELNSRNHNKLESFGITREIDLLKAKFRQYKINNSLIDFEDMMDYCIELLSANDSLKNKISQSFDYILVDEFQDTSDNNFILLKLILKDKPNLFMVGDDWQSIYGFRNARIDYILKIRKHFNEAYIHKLTVNYRSKKEIVNLSNSFIKKNKHRTAKKLKSFNGKGGTIKSYKTDSFANEIKIIKNILKAENGDGTAILYRNNAQGRLIENALTNDGISNARLMTMHSSKGLEFNTVIIAGISDEIIPDPSSDIEEERRLLYVALTRAKERLHIIHHVSANNDLSQFAKELNLG